MSYPADRLGQVIGHYRLTRLLGLGSFAEVYLGEHIYLGTQAAIKILATRLSEDEIAHFQHEAQLIAQLEHPHIIRIFDFGIQDHLPFLVMSYAPHGSLRQHHPQGTRLPLATVVDYVKQIASALQYAHDQRLIHRDIKPENILMGRTNDVLLSDFGLAVIAQSSSRNHIHDVSGTVAYMAPEQARGWPNINSDQYSLAIMVYEWLSGKRPFQGTYEEVMLQHTFASPSPLTEHNPAIPAAIAVIIMRALEKDVHRRFSSVQAFAQALEQAYLTEHNTTQPSSPAQATASTSFPASTNSTIQTNNRYQGTASETGQGTDTIYAITWSPDSRRIAYGGQDRSVQIRGATTGDSTLIYKEHGGSITMLAWSPDGQYIASASLDRTIHVWHARNGERVATYGGHSGMVSALVWSPDSSRIASTCSADHSIHVWSPENAQVLLTYPGHTNLVRALTWAPNGKIIASGSWQEIQIWDSDRGHKHFQYRGHHSWIRAIAWSPQETLLASAGEDDVIQLWEPLNKGHLVAQYRGHNDWVQQLRWSSDGRWIASGSRDYNVHIWDSKDTHSTTQHPVRARSPYTINWLPDNKHVVCASGHGNIQVWQANSKQKSEG